MDCAFHGDDGDDGDDVYVLCMAQIVEFPMVHMVAYMVKTGCKGVRIKMVVLHMVRMIRLEVCKGQIEVECHIVVVQKVWFVQIGIDKSR